MSFDVAALVAQEARRAGDRDQSARVSWGDVTDVTDPLFPAVDGAPARNVTGRPLEVGQQVRLITVGRDRLIFGIDEIVTPDPPPDPDPPAGGGWETIWKDEAGDPITEGLPAVQLNSLAVGLFDDYSSLRLTIFYIGGDGRPMNRSLVELSGFGGLTEPTVALAPGEQYSIVMEADRHVGGMWSARIHDVAPLAAVDGRATAETIGAWQNVVMPEINVTVWPLQGARYVSGWLYGLPYQED